MTAGTATPRGIGIYYSRIARAWSDREAAEEVGELRDMRASYVLFCVEATTADGLGWRADHAVLAANAGHLHRAGIRVGVYALPSERAWLEPEALADRLADAGNACGSDLWVPDVEEQARGKGSQVRRFRKRLTERAREGISIMVTCYGRVPREPKPSRPADGRFPWIEIVGWGAFGYQLYKSAEDDARVDAMMADAAVHWQDDIIPHHATYLGDAARLDADIERTCTRGGELFVVGLAIWQKSTTSAAERAVLAKWAVRFEDAALARRRADDTQRLRPGA